MEVSSTQIRPDTQINAGLVRQRNAIENGGAAIEAKPDNGREDVMKNAGGTVKFSDAALKLSAASKVNSADLAPAIENSAKARDVLENLKVDMSNNPSQAILAHSSSLSTTIKPLLG